jgi:hypothetical protein
VDTTGMAGHCFWLQDFGIGVSHGIRQAHERPSVSKVSWEHTRSGIINRYSHDDITMEMSYEGNALMNGSETGKYNETSGSGRVTGSRSRRWLRARAIIQRSDCSSCITIHTVYYLRDRKDHLVIQSISIVAPAAMQLHIPPSVYNNN